ncbi:hypothetical protein ACE5IS_05905 [Leptospira wolffii]|uniref:Uncharacterized protein n=1 Tax=Leptospira wolffii TaxID=409998 RepID=A0ABV5BIK2_9LEPT|nr:hypothetical protein [Leptospira wolffii]EPG65599.1 hypothetical protein LEP1GSC061_3069 [Leptospira wolffii serovar Khorat str. Khorat-H2]TGL54219.1 hypothetical protein EHQ61_02735 [Leptospira wolffii]
MGWIARHFELIILAALTMSGLSYLYILLTRNRRSKTDTKSFVQYNISVEDSSGIDPNRIPKKKEPKVNVLEVFDYNGIKIMHENGLYTVNHAGEIQVYASWQALPPRYQAMVKEMDKSSIGQKKKGNYYMEVLNGIYYVVFPDGKRQKYPKFEDIPEKIRKALGY